VSGVEPDLAPALERAADKLERSLEGFRAAREMGVLPHVTEDGRWRFVAPLGREESALTGLPWTGGFVAGQLWLASRLPGRGRLAAEAVAVTDLLAPRADRSTTHDLGFLFWPSAVLGYRATGEIRFRELALRAAASLVQRRLSSGVLQVVGRLGDPDLRGRAIVDTLPNLVLLWWAEREGFPEAGEAARSHARVSARAFVRSDGSTVHAIRFADDATVLERATINGYAAGSTWARGQAWAILGFAAAYRAGRDAELLSAAERTARFFLDRLPADGIPPWDFDAPAGGPKDASAAAIAASALLDLADAGVGTAPELREQALGLLRALCASCLNRGEDDGILLHCCYRYPARQAVDAATLWGDFFFLDALVHAVEPGLRLDALAR
jgi:unsaturated chondroitin disaccharide hydrolase